VRGVVERDGIVVFLGTTKGTERAVIENAKRLGRNGFASTKWLPGTFLAIHTQHLLLFRLADKVKQFKRHHQ
jgi:ribosomal protein S2